MTSAAKVCGRPTGVTKSAAYCWSVQSLAMNLAMEVGFSHCLRYLRLKLRNSFTQHVSYDLPHFFVTLQKLNQIFYRRERICLGFGIGSFFSGDLVNFRQVGQRLRCLVVLKLSVFAGVPP